MQGLFGSAHGCVASYPPYHPLPDICDRALRTPLVLREAYAPPSAEATLGTAPSGRVRLASGLPDFCPMAPGLFRTLRRGQVVELQWKRTLSSPRFLWWFALVHEVSPTGRTHNDADTGRADTRRADGSDTGAADSGDDGGAVDGQGAGVAAAPAAAAVAAAADDDGTDGDSIVLCFPQYASTVGGGWSGGGVLTGLERVHRARTTAMHGGIAGGLRIASPEEVAQWIACLATPRFDFNFVPSPSGLPVASRTEAGAPAGGGGEGAADHQRAAQEAARQLLAGARPGAVERSTAEVPGAAAARAADAPYAGEDRAATRSAGTPACTATCAGSPPAARAGSRANQRAAVADGGRANAIAAAGSPAGASRRLCIEESTELNVIRRMFCDGYLPHGPLAERVRAAATASAAHET